MTQLHPSQEIALGITEYMVNHGFNPTMPINQFYLEIARVALLSESHQKQDVLVQALLSFKTNGYFVEFGASDGIKYNNTYLLEKEYGWTGILSEPGKSWHNDLNKNRNCIVDTRCVWSTSGETLSFNEVSNDTFLSSIDEFKNVSGNKYNVNSISLNDLLDEHNAPNNIDYLSIDTKGGEYEILSTFDFGNYNINIITCNHQFANTRNNIYTLLTNNGFVRICNEVSWMDDWYIKPEYLNSMVNTDNTNFNNQLPPSFNVSNLI